jgi:hypothetical protein
MGKDVKVYCKFWKKIIETVSRSQEVKLRGNYCGIFLNTGCVEAIESIIWVVISIFVQISWSPCVKNYLLFQVVILVLVYINILKG